MEQEKLQEFKKLLEDWLEQLLNEADNTVSTMTDSRKDFADPTDRASHESDRNFVLRIRDRERKLIMKIKSALDRIEDGTFGICDECGEEISESRLRARPVTTLCIHCKTESEAREKRGNG